MPITRDFKLYLNAGRSIPLVINANQYDSGETWLFTLYTDTGEVYTPSSGAIIGIKADGHVIDNAATVDSRGRVVVTETEQMTAAAGKAVFEISIDDNSHGTANFMVLVEPKPSDGGILSDSDLSLIQEAIDSTSPAAIAQGVSDWMDDHLAPSQWVIDDSLTVQGAAADAKATGEAIAAVGGGLTADIKAALMNCFNYVAWKDNDPNAQQYIDALEDALYPPANLVSISAVYTQSGTVYDTDSLDSLKPDLVVTAHYSDATTAVVSDYVLSGTLVEGTSTITVTYGGKTTTFNVTVTEEQLIPDGTYTFPTTGEVVTITNGNHFSVTLQNTVTSTGGFFINLSDLTKNAASSTSSNNGSAINNLSNVLFNVPANSSVEIEMLNPTLTRANLLTNDVNAEVTVGFRKTGASTSAFSGVSLKYSTETLTRSNTITESTDVSCIFMYYQKAKAVTLEFDLSLTINGEQVL